MSLRIVSLHVHPVKSFRPIGLTSARLTPLGLLHDRAWLVVDGDGRFLSQRRAPAMARVETALTEDHLLLRRKDLPECRVLLAQRPGNRRVTEVWGDRCEVIDQGDAAARWLEKALGADHAPRLVRMAPGFRRGQRRPERYGEDTTTFFADTAPFLIVNTASLDDLNEALVSGGKQPVPMDRFRANIVLEGLAPFREQAVGGLQGPGYRLGLRYPRERCVMTTLDQATGARDPNGEPFRTLRRINPMPGDTDAPEPAGPAFGMLGVLEAGNGARIRVGDRLEVFTTG